MSAEPTFAYVVMCHHKPDQALRVARTIRRLSRRARILLRHDRPTEYISEAQANAAGADLLVSTIRGRWGHWSLVQATLEAFDCARRLYRPAWTVLISGQDYPVRPLGVWEDELLRAGCDAVVAGEPLAFGPVAWRFRDPEDSLRMRYTHRWRWLPQPGLIPHLPPIVVRAVRAIWYRHLYQLQAVAVLNELPRDNGWVFGLRRRTVPFTPQAPAYKGEQWLALSSGAVAAALDSPRARSWQDWYRTTLIPDESYFPTVLADAHGLRVDPTGISWHRWHTDVSRPHPIDITLELLDEVARSRRPFARKFDETANPGMLDAVDRLLLGDALADEAT